MLVPKYTLQDIQLSVGNTEFSKGLQLFRSDKVGVIQEIFSGFESTVSGTEKYIVVVDSNHFDKSECNCYLGQKNYLCKHVLALAIAVVHKYRPQDMAIIDHPLDQAVCSGNIGDISEQELSEIENEIKVGLGYIKSWSGPSKRWFEYQDNLSKGSRIILLVLSKLPICEKSVVICISLLKKLDKKLLGSVDDSDGTIGNLMEEIIELLCMLNNFKKDLGPYIAKSLPKGEVFDWESGFFTFNEDLKKYQKK